MSSALKTACCAMIVISLAWSAGCRKEPAPAPPPPAQPGPGTTTTDTPAGGESATEGTPAADEPQSNTDPKAAEIEAAFASLTIEDRDKATSQKICPVSGEELGTMGAPIKVAVAGQEVFICCEQCKDPLLADPETHLAKINLKPAEEPAPQ